MRFSEASEAQPSCLPFSTTFFVASMNSLILDIALSPHLEIADYATLVHQVGIIPFWLAVGLAEEATVPASGEYQYRDCGSCGEGRVAGYRWADLQVWLFDHGGIGHAWCRLPLDSVSVLDRLQPIVTRSNKRMC